MYTAILRPLPRALLIGTLALAGTIGSFAVTTAPAHAAPRGIYDVTLAKPVETPRREIVNGAMWRCEGAQCTAEANGERALSVCGKVARQFGEVARFEGPQGELDGEALARCNAAVVRQ
jgi:hypothetical protein